MTTNTPKTISVKKVWQKPDFVILDNDNVNNKSHPTVKEGTGYQSGAFFYTQNGNGSFFGTRNQAIS